MPGLSAFAPRGLMPVAKVRAGHNWADARLAKTLIRDKLMMWLKRGGIIFRNHMVQEAPHGVGHGRSWINSTEDDMQPIVYVGIIGPSATTKGTVPYYMGMIEKGITPHMVSLKHRGLRMWWNRTFGAPKVKRSREAIGGRAMLAAFSEVYGEVPGVNVGISYRSVMTWKSTKTFGGIRRESIGGKTAIPWLSRGIKKGLPEVRAELQTIARTN